MQIEVRLTYGERAVPWRRFLEIPEMDDWTVDEACDVLDHLARLVTKRTGEIWAGITEAGTVTLEVRGEHATATVENLPIPPDTLELAIQRRAFHGPDRVVLGELPRFRSSRVH